MPLYPEIEGLDVEELKAAFEGEPLDGPEYYRAFHDEVAIRIRQRGGSAEVEYLLGWVHRDDPRRIPSVFVALTWGPPRIDTQEVVELLVEALRHDDPDVVATAVRGLSSLQTDSGRDAVLGLRADARAHVRCAVLDYIAESDGMRSVDLIVGGLHDVDPIVRMAAVDALDELDAVEFGPAILRLKDDSDERVRHAVAWFVESREEG